MTASPQPLVPPCASTSSSGLADGLGRRTLAFDREEGTMLERLIVRPELAAFEPLLRDRMDRLAGIEDERIGRPRTIVRNADGALVVISEFVPGSRLSELLEAGDTEALAPGVDAAVGFLIDVLPALCGLHAGARFAHGTLAPPRIVVTPAGQVVLQDAIFGDALAHLRYGSGRLWTEFGVAVGPAPGSAPRVDARADVAQAALAAIMIVLGRSLGAGEWPSRRAGILEEVDEIAQIRGSGNFPRQFCAFLHQALAAVGDEAFRTADDALIEARGLAASLGGTHACRRALVEWAQRLDGSAVESDAVPAAGPDEDDSQERSDSTASGVEPMALCDEDELLSVVIETIDDEEENGHVAEWQARALDGAGPGTSPLDGQDGADAHIDLDLDALIDDAFIEEDTYSLDVPPSTVDSGLMAEAYREFAALELAELDPGDSAQDPDDRAGGEARAVTHVELPTPAVPSDVILGPAPFTEPEPPPEAVAAPGPGPAMPANGHEPVADEQAGTITPVTAAPPVRTRRAKRTRSARTRKDKLRSVASGGGLLTGMPAHEAPDAQAAPADRASAPREEALSPVPAAPSWMVRPDRAATFNPAPDTGPSAPPAPIPFPAARPPVIGGATQAPLSVLPPPVPVYFQPPSPGPPPAPYPAPAPVAAPPSFGAPGGGWRPVAPPSPPPQTIAVARAPVALALKVKEPAPRHRAARPSPEIVDIYAAPRAVRHEPPARFPWKLAVLVVAVIAVAVVAGRAYIPARVAIEDEGIDALRAASSAAPPYVPPAAPTGHLTVDTQPSGARVLLDGAPAGQTPLTIPNVPAGRHSVTVVTPAGSVTRTVRIDAGKTVTLDLPIFSGWIAVFAPFVVEVSTGGRVIGTTGEPRIMLPPGRHQLTLSNRELGYRSVQTVEIEPGHVRTLTLDPRGSANVNATPWAEVWIDGRKAGDTPIANLTLPLGTREIVFRHPQLGERRTTATIKGSGTAAISMDMTR